MKSFRICLLLGFVLIFLLVSGCQDKATNSEASEITGTIEVEFEELYNNNIIPDSLIISVGNSNKTNYFTYKHLQSQMELYINIDFDAQTESTINTTLYWGDSNRSAYSKFRIDENNFIGNLKAKYYHQNVILTLDTNPARSVAVSDFYNFTALDKFFKEYKIENVEAIADQYCNTPMNFLMEHGILWHLLDENMIPVYPYPFGNYYNPVLTCNNAFGFYDQYIKTDNQDYLAWFYVNADWIIDYKDSDSFLKYAFENTHETVTLPFGWTSAMAQGQALALMCIAYHNSRDEKYLQAADEFFVTMHTNNATSWNFYIDDEDYLWYEEYPSSDFCHVLNGKLFATWGLWEYYCITRDNDALRLFQGSIASVIDHYPLWDIDGVDGSRYCKHTNTVSSYHWIHKAQLMEYYNMFNINEFKIFHDTITNQRNK